MLPSMTPSPLHFLIAHPVSLSISLLWFYPTDLHSDVRPTSFSSCSNLYEAPFMTSGGLQLDLAGKYCSIPSLIDLYFQLLKFKHFKGRSVAYQYQSGV